MNVPFLRDNVLEQNLLFCPVLLVIFLSFELDNRDKFIDFMRDEGVDAQVTFIDDWNVVFGDGKPMANTQKMITRTASLPLSPFLSEAEVDTIISAVKKFYKQG